MAVAAIYPSQRQSKAYNPLFARQMRRQKLGFMLLLTMMGLGLLFLQVLPMAAHADDPSPAMQDKRGRPVGTPNKSGVPEPTTVRQIKLYASRSGDPRLIL